MPTFLYPLPLVPSSPSFPCSAGIDDEGELGAFFRPAPRRSVQPWARMYLLWKPFGGWAWLTPKMSCFIKIVHVRQDCEEIYLVHSHTNKQTKKQTNKQRLRTTFRIGMLECIIRAKQQLQKKGGRRHRIRGLDPSASVFNDSSFHCVAVWWSWWTTCRK